jgi:FixJ family two-component response regulator
LKQTAERMVYVVDDDPSIRRAFGRMGPLMRCGIETFESAEAFLERDEAAAERSVLVVDYRLPGMNGAQLYARLKEMGSDVPVLFITAHDNAITRETLEAIHAERVYIKPLDFEGLIEAIKDLLTDPEPPPEVHPEPGEHS